MAGPVTDPRLDITSPLRPGDAVAAIITVEGEYLLQHRDPKFGIWFPSVWGCFGGGLEPGETLDEALVREIEEELAITLRPASYRHFTRFDFDFGFAGAQRIWREFYEVTLTREEAARMRLGEGQNMGLHSVETILTRGIHMTPYDEFALWMHINRGRIGP